MIKELINHRRVLYLPMVRLGVVVVIMSLLISGAVHYKSNQAALLSGARADYDAARYKLQLSKQEQHDIMQYLPRYQYLLQSGFIGKERRNDWVERLYQVSTHYQLFNVDYKIGRQTSYHPNFRLNLGRYEMHRSVMILKWGLLHENDFINLLSGLREKVSPFMVRDCEIALAPDVELDSQAMQQNLIASCVIDWLTIQDPTLKGNF